jgi:hypothetical protein
MTRTQVFELFENNISGSEIDSMEEQLENAGEPTRELIDRGGRKVRVMCWRNPEKQLSKTE